MSRTTIAIAARGSQKVELWCDGVKRRPNGTVSFYVINGAWNGALTKDGQLRINVPASHDGRFKARTREEPGPYDIVWEGKAPFSDVEYNEAIQWIEGQIKAKGTSDGTTECADPAEA